jgi:nucleoside-diphosphate-sugar epimerase
MDFFSHHWRWADKSGKPLVLPTRLAQELTRGSEWIFRKVLQQPTEISSSSLAMLTRSSSYSIAKAQTQLHYQPKIDLLTGMQQTERWLHDHKMIG